MNSEFYRFKKTQKLLIEVIQELETLSGFPLTISYQKQMDKERFHASNEKEVKERKKKKKEGKVHENTNQSTPKDPEWVRGIAMDSRKVEHGFIFIAIKGQKTDGHQYLDQALEKGAICFVVEKAEEEKVKEWNYPVPVIFYSNTTVALALLCKIFYRDPSSRMTLIGITGTNGKTTTSYMIREILRCDGRKTGLLGTISCSISSSISSSIGDSILEKSQEAQLTTPDVLSIYEFLSQAEKEGVGFVVMEISSHSIVQNRVLGLELDALIVTSFSEDHLDFHRTMKEYLSSKLEALTLLKKSSKTNKLFLVNRDMSSTESFLKRAKELELDNIETYALEEENEVSSNPLEKIPLGKKKADYIASEVKLEMDCSSFFLENTKENSKTSESVSMSGRFNVYNSLATWSLCRFFGISVQSIRKGLNQVQVPGRFERIEAADFSIIVDYAHTDDALWNVLSSIRDLLKGKDSKHRILTVFGCGGERDREKRPLMGRVASEGSDFLFVTSDNPRTEDPMQIIEEILVGVRQRSTPYEVIPDRRQAIQKAVEFAEKGDILLIAGKGHENYQILKDQTIHFDDREEVEKVLKKLNKERTKKQSKKKSLKAF